QALLTDEVVIAVLRNAGRHLAPGGRLAFETRNPAVEEWRSWNPAAWRELAEIPGLGRVEETGEVEHDPATGIVTIRHLYRYLDLALERRAVSRIRFIGEAHLARLIEEAGLVPLAFYGWWDRSPVTPESPEIIAVVGRPD